MLGLPLHQLWLDYLGLGGCLLPGAIGGFLASSGDVSDYDHDLLAQALNEHFLTKGENHPLAYADELRPPAG